MNYSNLANSKTYSNLVNAFAGECQARTRYSMLAEKCKTAGFCALSEFVKTIATNEFEHAERIYTFITSASDKPIPSLNVNSGYPFKEKENDLIEAFHFAAENEGEEALEIYPSFARIAREEGFDIIADFFEKLVQIESCHKMAFTELYNHLKNGTLYKRTSSIKWKCSLCGFEATAKEAWQKCPVCGAAQGEVMLEMSE